MPRIYSALYQPYTYDELLKPVQASTEAHKLVEKEYTDSMMIVDALRSRAEQEPNTPWALNIINYANQLEGYATDLMQNGLTGTTPANLMSMHSGFGKTVTPVAKAVERQDTLQKIRDLHVGDGMVFAKMPSIQDIIDNPSIGQNAYDYNKIYERAKAAAAAKAARNIDVISPRTYNKYLYQYGTRLGYSNEDIDDMRKTDPEFNKMFNDIVEEFGFEYDNGLDEVQKNQLRNAIASGAMAGFTYKPDYHYGNIPQWAVQPQNPTTGTRSGYGLPTRTYPLPISLFRPWIKPKVQEENNQLRNQLNNNKNIVFGYGENGLKLNKLYISLLHKAINGGLTFNDLDYIPDNISVDMLKDINLNPLNNLITEVRDTDRLQELLNRELKRQQQNNTSSFWSATRLAADVAKDIMFPGLRVADEYFQNQAKLMGIKKGDSEKTVALKVSDYINNGPSYSELSDAVVGEYITTPLNQTNKDEISAHYTLFNNNVQLLAQRDDGTFYPSDKSFNPNDYIPQQLMTVKYNTNQPSQTVLLWRHKSKDQEVVSLYYDSNLGNAISSLIDQAWNNDIIRKDIIDNGIMHLMLSKQSPDLIINNDLILNVDDNILNDAIKYWYKNGEYMNQDLTHDLMINMLNNLLKNNSDQNKLNTFQQIYAQLYYYYQYLGQNGKEYGLTLDMCDAANIIANNLYNMYALELGLEDDIDALINDAHRAGVKSQAHSIDVQPTKIQ